MINLKGRLLKIANLVEECSKLADIGTDHGYIPIYLVQSGICQEAIATDIRKGPLLKAERNIDKYKLKESIELRLGNGIEPIQNGECDVFIIAGMGGRLITDILERSLRVVQNTKYILLQPVYTEEVLREFLLKNGFRIAREVLVQDEGRIYVVIKAVYDGIIRQEEDLYCHIGSFLFEHKDPLLKEFLKRRIKRQTKIVHGMEKSERMQDVLPKERGLLRRMQEVYAGLNE